MYRRAFSRLCVKPSDCQGGKVVTVNGKKYGLKGGFKREFLSNMPSPQLARLFGEAADQSLAFNTWKSYESCWNQLGAIQKKMDLIISL